MSRTVDEIADDLLDVREAYVRKMLELEKEVSRVRDKYETALMKIEDEAVKAGLLTEEQMMNDGIEWGSCEGIVWKEPGDLAVQFKEAVEKAKGGV